MRAGWWKRTAARSVVAGVCAVAAAGTASCGKMNTDSKSPSYLIVNALEAWPGLNMSAAGTLLQSDVQTFVKGSTTPTVYEDTGQVTMRMALKDVGLPSTPTLPTTTNMITVTRYHVEYRRSDGRNTQGVDVPFAFDGGVTASVESGDKIFTFVLVRAQAKLEAPLLALRGGGGSVVISTVAYVTFYGQDQNGNPVSVTGTISVNFGDWADSTT